VAAGDEDRAPKTRAAQRLAGKPAGDPGAKREERVDVDPVSQTAVDSKGCRWTFATAA
jgi:hypothetical protein